MSNLLKRGDIVQIHTKCLHPQIDGLYQLKKVRRFSNFPYRIIHEGEEILIEKREATYAGKIA